MMVVFSCQVMSDLSDPTDCTSPHASSVHVRLLEPMPRLELNTKVTFVEAYSCFLFSAKYFSGRGQLGCFHQALQQSLSDLGGIYVYPLGINIQFVKSEDSVTLSSRGQTSVCASTLRVSAFYLIGLRVDFVFVIDCVWFEFFLCRNRL